MDFLPSNPSHHGIHQGEAFHGPQGGEKEGGLWYYSWKELEENSPSGKDGITMKKETKLRTLYSKFLQDLGMRLKVPQVTIATAVIFCHRFFLRQSHAKNDWMSIATVCMFLAGKVEETPRPLKDLVIVSYEIIHKQDSDAIQTIKQKEVYERRKELILLGENVVLATLGFDLNVNHPYKPLVEAIKRFKVAQNALAQVAWNFVNDGLRTSLCLQFRPHQIAAGAIFLAAKFLKVKLPSHGERVWWQEFDVTPSQLEDVSNQMLELYEQNKKAALKCGEVEGSIKSKASLRPSAMEEHASSETGGSTFKHQTTVGELHNPVSEQIFANNNGEPPRPIQCHTNDYMTSELKGTIAHQSDSKLEDNQPEALPNQIQNVSTAMRFRSDELGEENNDKIAARSERRELGESKDKKIRRNPENGESKLGLLHQEAIRKIDRDKVKAALEKTRKSRNDVPRKTDMMDADDLIEKELEDGVELASVSSWKKPDRRESTTPLYRTEFENIDPGNHEANNGDIERFEMKGFSSDMENLEDALLHDSTEQNVRSAKSSNYKGKTGSPLNKTLEVKRRHEYGNGSSYHYKNHEDHEDRSKMARLGYMERDQKRHVPEYHF